MVEPSAYELDAWRSVQEFKGRQISGRMAKVGQRVADTTSAAGSRTADYLDEHPRANAVVQRGVTAAAKSGHVVASGAAVARGRMPMWVGKVGGAATRSTAKVSRAGLSPTRVVARHQKRGHDVKRLQDVRQLDLEQVDAVKGRRAEWLYPAVAAMSGAGAGLVITGGQATVVASAGASAAPSTAAVAGAFVGDAAAVLALGSRVVGRTALMYGYDPEAPAEKLFIMSVINAGSAATAGAKTAAFKDISKLTQALVRGKTWAVLNESVVSRVATQFAKHFTERLSKQGLGKLVPAASVAIGGTLNWATVEGIVDAAEVAYRRRFLLEKYPYLAEGDSFGTGLASDREGTDVSDVEISVLRDIADAGGPDLD